MYFEIYTKGLNDFIIDVLNGVKFFSIDDKGLYQNNISCDSTLERLKQYHADGRLFYKKKPSLKDYLNNGGTVLIVKDGCYQCYKGKYYEGVGRDIAREYHVNDILKHMWFNIKKELDK